MEKVRKILFVGGLFPKNSELVIKKSRGNIQNAANVFQWNIIDGLNENGIFPTVISLPFVGSWPLRFADVIISKNSLEKDSKNKINYVGFLNLPVIKNISRYFSTKRAIKKYLISNNDSEASVILYSAHTPFVRAVASLKRKYKFQAHLVVPDLPQYMNLSGNQKLAYRILKKMDMSVFYKCVDSIDSFTFLTKQMNAVMNRNNKPFAVVEGMVNEKDVRNENEIKEQILKSVVYTGGMDEKYGVKRLVDATDYFDPNIKLVLCGTGDLDSYIKGKANSNDKIIFKGLVPREEALKIQSEATILTNPRTNDEEYTNYSFPSKNLEYMLWGKPVLVNKLNGMPDEYDSILMFYDDSTPESMAAKINSICGLSDIELSEIGEKIKNFALKNKSAGEQTKKIIGLLNM